MGVGVLKKIFHDGDVALKNGWDDFVDIQDQMSAHLLSLCNRVVIVHGTQLECRENVADLHHPIRFAKVAGEHIAAYLDTGVLCIVNIEMEILAKAAIRPAPKYTELIPVPPPRRGEYPRDDASEDLMRHGTLIADSSGKYIGVYTGSRMMSIYQVGKGPQGYKSDIFPLAISAVRDLRIPPFVKFAHLINLDKDVLLWTCRYTKLQEILNILAKKDKDTDLPEVCCEIHSIDDTSDPLVALKLKQKPRFACFDIDYDGNALLFGSGTVTLVRINDFYNPVQRYIGPQHHVIFALSYPSPGRQELFKWVASDKQQFVEIFVDGGEINEAVILERTSNVMSSRTEMAVVRSEKDPSVLRVVMPERISVVDTKHQKVLSSLPIKPVCTIM